jgi:hypothetical protein
MVGVASLPSGAVSRDIQVKVMLSPEEFVAFRAICDEQGHSQSGQARALIKQYIRDYAQASAGAPAVATDGEGQD